MAGAGLAAVAWQYGGGRLAFLCGAVVGLGALVAHLLPVRALRLQPAA